jgi:hypothetical protein
MRADYRVVLDACVLIPMPLVRTLLRMAEAPRLYLPKWSQTIMDQVTRNLIAKWEMAPENARRREEELRRHFPEAWVEGFQPIIDVMTNDPGDRHVLAGTCQKIRGHSGLASWKQSLGAPHRRVPRIFLHVPWRRFAPTPS